MAQSTSISLFIAFALIGLLATSAEATGGTRNMNPISSSDDKCDHKDFSGSYEGGLGCVFIKSATYSTRGCDKKSQYFMDMVADKDGTVEAEYGIMMDGQKMGDKLFGLWRGDCTFTMVEKDEPATMQGKVKKGKLFFELVEAGGSNMAVVDMKMKKVE